MPGYELIGREERDAVMEIFDKHGGILFKHGFDSLRKGSYKVTEFEKSFARYLNAGYAQAVTSGTVALKVALEALGINPGDEVVTQSFTFVATVEAIVEARAVPVLTDVNETLNMDPADLERKITKKTKVIIPVHMYGAPAQMDEIMAIAKKRGIVVLEDAAQAAGVTYKGIKLGAIAKVGTFSFDFGKALTTGEGGMVVTNDREIYLKAREYSDHGHENNANFPRGEDTRRRSGFNYRMMELQAAIGIAQLAKLDYAIRMQRENKRRIKGAIKDAGKFRFRIFADPDGESGDTLVLIFESPERAKTFVEGIRAGGLATKNLPDAFNWHFAGTWDHIFSPIERYRGGLWRTEWKRSEELLRRTVALPVFIKMSNEQIEKTITVIREVSGKIR